MTRRLREILARFGRRTWLLAACVSALLFGILIWWTGPSRLIDAFTSAHPGFLAVAVAIYLAVLGVRWARVAGLLTADVRDASALGLLWTVTGHGLATHLLPARTGELAFPELLHRATAKTRSEGLVYLTAIRLVELGVLVPFLAIGVLAWNSGSFDWLPWGGIGVGVGFVLLLPWTLSRAVDFAAWLILETRLADVDWLAPLREAAPRARNAAEALGLSEWFWLVATTAAMWIALFGVYWCVLAACGVHLGAAQTVVGAAGGIVGNLLPVGAVGSWGAMEAGWTAAFRATGAPAGPVLAAALLVHVLVVAVTGTTAAVARSLDSTQE